MVELKYFERSDFDQLIGWVDSPEFLLQWSGSQFDYPLNEAQLVQYLANANHELEFVGNERLRERMVKRTGVRSIE